MNESHRIRRAIPFGFGALLLLAAGLAAPSAVGVEPSPVLAWGDDMYGAVSVPTGLDDAIAVAGGGHHSVALKSGGTVVAWGWNDQGQSDVPAGLSDVVAIGAGVMHTFALKSDGTVVAWGIDGGWGETQVPAGLSGVVGLATGNGAYYTTVILADGTLRAWGDDRWGQTSGAAVQTDIAAVSANYTHALAVKTDGTVVAWGADWWGQTVVPAGLGGVVAIAAGEGHSVALKGDGTVVAWGDNSRGQTAVPAGLSDVVAIAAGRNFTLAQKSDGTVVGWGGNDYGERVPAGQTVSVLAAGWSHVLALPAPQAQTITFDPLPDRLVAGAPFAVSASATSGLTVTFTSSTTAVCTVSGTTVTLLSAGTCTIVAQQAGGSGWLPAPDLAQSFVVGYAVGGLLPPNKTAFKAGSTIAVRFRLVDADGSPIAGTDALGTTATVSFDGGAPIRARYQPGSAVFMANVKTPRGLVAGHDYPIDVQAVVGTTIVASSTTMVTAS